MHYDFAGLPRADPELRSLYTYDAMERLTKESLNGAVTSYGYDLAGNRITKSTDGRTIMMQKATAIPDKKFKKLFCKGYLPIVTTANYNRL